MERPPGSVHTVLAGNGGIVPRERCRSKWVLSFIEREEISRGIASGDSCRQIAQCLGRSSSTICREIERCGGRQAYRAASADELAWDRARRAKKCLLSRHSQLRVAVAEKLAMQWSPEQIAGWLAIEFANDDNMRVSHETIYKTLFIQTRGALKKELISHLRKARSIRSSKHASTKGQLRGQIIDAVPISERPAEVEDRALPGHWEGDMISGSNNTHIATLVERHSRYVMLIKLSGKDTKTVVDALTANVCRLPDQLKQSITWDRGTELADHKRFTLSTDVQVYFCDPQSPWQRGSNENTNGLLRQYLPRKTDLSIHSQKDLDAIALRLNTRPRKTLGYQTPTATLTTALQRPVELTAAFTKISRS